MAAGDLTTLGNVRSFLQKQGSDVNQDEVIESLITQASAAIARTTERQFLPEDKATHTFEVVPWATGQAKPPLTNFAPYEIRDLDTITIDPDSASPLTLAAEEFRLWPKPNPDGTYFGVRINPFSAPPSSARWGDRREIAVLGDWGMAEIPVDVVNWCNVTVAIWLRRDVAAFEAGMNIDTGYLERPRALPSAVSSALNEGYKRRAGGP
jgi:hypothetical protein